MRWRPENWENPYTYKNLVAKPMGIGIDFANIPELTAYEAGADAMLEVLREHNNMYPGREIIRFIDDKPYKGTAVFIPAEDQS